MKLGPTFISALVGTALLGLLLFFAFHFQSGETRTQQLATKAKKIELADHVGLALASAAEAEKSAVLAITDQESEAFAKEARAGTATAQQQLALLGPLLQASGSTKQNELLTQFSTAFAEFQRVDRELLELAVKNTNIKASALAFGPAAGAIEELRGALSRILAESAKSGSGSARAAMLAAADAQSAALLTLTLLPPHIAEESDAKMDALEAQMTKQDQTVRASLTALAALVPSGNADLQTANAAYSRFVTLKNQIVKLSRENTNVRSLSISLNQKRKVTALCQEALAALERSLIEEHIAGVDDAPSRPR